jgi:hypothetical protein
MREGKLHSRLRNASYAICLGLCSTTLSVHPQPTSPPEQPGEIPFSVIILDADRLIYRDDKEVVFPNKPGATLIGEVYQAHVRSIKTLCGPEIPRDAIIMFAGNHLMSRMEGVSALKVVMVVRRDQDGYWGGQRWMEVGSKLCLDDDSIAEQKLEIAFSKAKRKRTGERCIRV